MDFSYIWGLDMGLDMEISWEFLGIGRIFPKKYHEKVDIPWKFHGFCGENM